MSIQIHREAASPLFIPEPGLNPGFPDQPTGPLPFSAITERAQEPPEGPRGLDAAGADVTVVPDGGAVRAERAETEGTGRGVEKGVPAEPSECRPLPLPASIRRLFILVPDPLQLCRCRHASEYTTGSGKE